MARKAQQSAATASPAVVPAAGQTLLVVLRGLGQVMFQRHAVTGLLFLVGLAIA